jgi:hypothetical protein
MLDFSFFWIREYEKHMALVITTKIGWKHGKLTKKRIMLKVQFLNMIDFNINRRK